MIIQRNVDLRKEIKKAGIFMWQLAEELQIHENTLYRQLRHNLSEEQSKRILHAIERLKTNCEGE
jgi:lambda repressor-like predicted transcriptional regulator